jgi:hypothetical protein
MEIAHHQPVLTISVTGTGPARSSLIVALRPYNPEGIQFIETVSKTADANAWLVNGTTPVNFSNSPTKMVFSNYQDGDVVHKLDSEANIAEIACDVGMATAAALFPLPSTNSHIVEVTVPLAKEFTDLKPATAKQAALKPAIDSWRDALAPTAHLRVPDTRFQFLYDAAVRSLVLLSADDIVPGPYTYRRFWYRDACLMLNALLAAGLTERAFTILDSFPGRQKFSGYFQSQEGEWDSNGQVLWIMDRYQQMTNHQFKRSWIDSVTKGADWIIRKRTAKKPITPHSGLLPPGFSAEHLGPNDYYYWDDFWALAGLRSAARLAGLFVSDRLRKKYEEEARDLEKYIFASIALIAAHRSKGGIPASPYRRMDAGAIGSMVADYPLQIIGPEDERISNTAEFLMENCFHQGAFFQDMIHSGMNIYLTLDIAQTLLRNRDIRYRQLIDTVAGLASSTGQWPEAIHPLTHGGCMGDGQHGWAAAEWLMMVRNLFVREEGDGVILGSGIFPQWLVEETPLHFGPTQTLFGTMEVQLKKTDKEVILDLNSDYTVAAAPPATIIVDVPGYRKITTETIERQHFILEER